MPGPGSRQPGRDVRCLTHVFEVKPVLVNLVQALLAVVLGNVVYFLLAPSLPPVARHQPFRLDLGMVLDFWFCLVAYGLIRTARRWK